MRPTKYLGASKSGRWSNVDRSLSEGLLTYEGSLNEVGIPSWIAQEPERRFGVDEQVDGAMALIEETREEMGKGENKTPGLRLVVSDLGPAES